MFKNQIYIQVEQYNIKYAGLENFIDADGLRNGKITVEVPSENTKIEARIRYEGYGYWSEWFFSDAPVSIFIT